MNYSMTNKPKGNKLTCAEQPHHIITACIFNQSAEQNNFLSDRTVLVIINVCESSFSSLPRCHSQLANATLSVYWGKKGTSVQMVMCTIPQGMET